MNRECGLLARVRGLSVVAATVCLLVLSHSVAAQDGATIIGQVIDESGAALPGVTVTATSPALQLPEVTAITDERGQYRITPLPIGTYSVLYTLSGFQPFKHEGLRLTVGFIAKLDVQLKIGSLEETITVSGVSPVVDVTSTGTRTELTRETIELTPTGRNGVISLLVQSPGVSGNLDVGGSSVGATTSFRAYGQTGESYVTLDGVFTTSSKDAQSGNFYDYSVLEEAKVQAVGNEVEIPVRGVSVATVLKSGSNQYHGGVFLAQTNDHLQSGNFDEKLQAQGAQKPGGELVTRWDRNVELGGKIVQDKLWFYGSTRFRGNTNTVLDVVQDDGSIGVNSERPAYSTEKVSYQLNRQNHIDFFHQWQRRLNLDGGTSVFVPWESRFDQGVRVNVGAATWQSIPTKSLMLSFEQGVWDFRNWYEAKAPRGKVATQDLITQYQTGPAQLSGTQAHEWRHHSKASAIVYQPNLFHGDHEFKTGFDFWTGPISRAIVSRGDWGNYVLLFNSAVPFEIRTQNSPVDPVSASRYLGLYARDSWTIARRLTLNLGARFAHDHGFVPAQCRPDAEPREFGPAECQARVDLKSWDSVAPRLYASYDLTGKGKTVVKGGWGRFDHMRDIQEVAPFNAITPTQTVWRWHDLNGDSAYQPGEVNLDPNGPDFVTVQTASLVGPFANGVPNPDEKQTKVDQFSVSIEQEVMPNFAIRLTGISSRLFNLRRILTIQRPYDVYNIPITNPDPGPDGTVGTSDDPGKSITYYDYPASLAGRQFEQRTWFTPDGAGQRFNSVEIAASKRLSRNWQLMASYSATKSDSPFAENSEMNPNAEINTANNTWEQLTKGSATYVFRHDLTVSARYEDRSGTPQARQVQFRGGRQIPSIVLNVEPIGSIRLPNIRMVDFRVEKGFRLTGTHTVKVWFNIYNLMNANTVTARSVRSGTSYLRPTAILPPRLGEFSVQYRF